MLNFEFVGNYDSDLNLIEIEILHWTNSAITKVLPLSQLPTDSKLNITLNERKCISILQSDESFSIKEAVKGGGKVMVKREYYRVLRKFENITV